jgi:CO/xanthine dehydrogenase Mo-binding subunit
MRYVGTAHLPYDSGVGGSRVSVSATEAAHAAALDLRDRLAAEAARQLGVPLEQVSVPAEGEWTDRGGRRLRLADLAATAAAAGSTVEVVGEVNPDPHAGHEEAATGYCVQIAQVGVDVETGQIFLYHLLSANDVAEILDPLTHQSQIEGSVIMGVGYALLEDLGVQDGQVGSAHLGDYKLPNIADLAPLEVVLVEGGKGVGARNIKAIGETANVPTAAAIANAVADAIGARVDSLPLTPEKVLRALRQG